MKYRKFNRYERKEIRAEAIKTAMAGSGLYIFQNSSANAELTLPRPTKSGKRQIEPGGRFQGDDYYMQLVRTGMLRLIEVLQTPEQETQAENGDVMLNESQEKLILDQPDQITQSGTVEHVVETDKNKSLNESSPQQNQGPVLLNEGPVADSGFVIVED